MAMGTFNSLLEALQHSVITAQELAEKQHQAQIYRYFDNGGEENPDAPMKPKMWTLEMPSPQPDKESETVKVALFSLIPPSSFKLETITFKMRVRLGGLEKKEDAHDHDELECKVHKHQLMINPNLGWMKGAPMADVEVTFAGCDSPEALLRINDHLIKSLP